jgi:two-component system OmpR family sensor kinase
MTRWPKRNVTTTADEKLVDAAARRIGIEIALACGLAIAVVAVLAFALLHGHGDGGRIGPARDEDADDLVRDALLIAGAIGIVIAGAVGYFSAKRAVRPLGDALALQRRFVADAGHELRTPLTVLHTRAQLLARRLPPDDPARAVAEELLGDSRLLGEIIDELLVSAQLSADPDRATIVDTREVIADALTTMRVLAEQSRVELVHDAAGGGVAVTVLGSRSALRRALVGLVDNAISHLAPGGTVWVSSRLDAGWVQITVTDDGRGLQENDAERLTERFARGREAQPAAAGVRPIGNQRYGLGLALVREIVVSHGGTFSLKNRPNSAGAVATIRIPSA